MKKLWNSPNAAVDPDSPDSAFDSAKDIYCALAVPYKLRPFVKRISLANCVSAVDFISPAKPTAGAFLGWHFGGRLSGWVDSAPEFDSNGPWLHVSGQLRHEQVQLKYSGRIRHLVIHFSALGAYQLLGIVGSDVAGRAIDAAGCTRRAQPIADALTQQFAGDSGDDVDGYVATITRHLTNCAEQPLPVAAYLHRAVSAADSNQGAIRVAELATLAGVSERQLNREFTRLVGLSPKFYCRIIQINTALEMMLDYQDKPMADIALGAKFTDQAHFNRVFRQFLDASPREFLNGDEVMLQHFLANWTDRG